MTTSPHVITETPRPAGRREWAGLAALALPALLASLELTVTHLALPAIGRDLGASSTELLWIVDVYAFLLAGSLITMGAWGDRIGRRRLLLIGAAGYGAASALAAYAPDPGTLIAARALMGVAGSTLMPSALALAAAMFPVPRQRAVAIGALVASVSAGTAIGPLAGGWLLDRFWWGSGFLIAVPVMALLLAAAPPLLPEHRGGGTARLDPLSALLSLGAVLPAVYGLKRIAAEGPGPVPLAAVAASVALGALFARRQRRLADPFLDLGLFRDRAFSAGVVTLGLGIFVLWGSNYAIAQCLQLVHGLSPLEAGLWTAPSAAGVIAGSTLAPRLARRIRPAVVIAAGLAVSAAGYALLAFSGGGLAPLVAGAVVVSAGLGPMMTLATDIVIGAAPPDRAGAASAVSTTAPQLGGALGVAVLGSVITAVYRASMPAGVAPAARDTLAAAVSAAEALPPDAASALLAVAREAYVRGFQVTAAVSAVLMAGVALLVAAVLRRTPAA
ncbi:MFS transporter [Bailinhaonella thermotolerans]|uniref:MFS transporter n=1 Tax=Bailinhaonella thermotolerans TaxID=1070861 RepID=A0A3A4AY56_9ACTN|nr:MFS transporter [Bailinhaonella thermotolerans]RJL34043.1 MFS transporter [Bailinhaonella thermotolerans]